MIGLDVLLGGITGLFGNAITGFMNYKTLKIKNDHDQKMVSLNTSAMKEKARVQIAVAKAKIDGAIDLEDSRAYTMSQEKGNERSFSDKWIDRLFLTEGKYSRFFAIPCAIILAMGFGFVDWLRGFMRPAITIYLTGMTTVITYMAWQIMQKHGLDTMSVQEAIGIYSQVISIIIYLTVSCVTWWFGDRRMAKFLTQINKRGN